jgi:hypothetical protein
MDRDAPHDGPGTPTRRLTLDDRELSLCSFSNFELRISNFTHAFAK